MPLVSIVGKLGAQNKIVTMVIIYVTFNLSLSIMLKAGYMKNIYTSDMGATFAALTVAILPIIIIYLCLQEKVISGLSSGSLKG